MRADILDALLAARAAKHGVALVTRLSDGVQCLVGEDGIQGELRLDEAQLVEVRCRVAADKSGLLDSGGEDLFMRAYVPPARLFIVGAVHVTQVLAPMAAMAGYGVTVIDPRRAWATEQRFPGVELSVEWPDDALARLAPDSRSAIVTLSHDPKLDDPALIAALNSPAFYIGALGSTRTHAKRVERLTAAGLADKLHRIHAPVGLDLGGRAPAEIAVSVLAQIVQARHRGAAAR